MSRNDSFDVGSSPEKYIASMSEQYSKQHGLHVPPSARGGFGRVSITRPASADLSAAYDSLPQHDREAVPAFHQMAEETKRQYDFLTKPRHKGGMGIDIEVTKEDPYGHGKSGVEGVYGEIRKDVAENNRIKVFSTKSTGGHPLFTDDENDMFRGVHDIFGHLGSGRGVDHHGEEAAYQKHSSMFSPLARQAMATETRGQNSALRVHGEFQDQKVALLPEHMQSAQFARKGSMTDIHAATTEARQRNARQGIG